MSERPELRGGPETALTVPLLLFLLGCCLAYHCSRWLALYRVSDNVGGVKRFLSTLRRALRESAILL
jgi:hypothetical protein